MTVLRPRLFDALTMLEPFSGLAAAGWALVNRVSPNHLSQRNFWPLLDFVSEARLEEITLAVGLFQVGAVVVGKRVLRGWAAFFATSLFCDLAATLIIAACREGRWPSGVVAIYVSLCLGNAVALCRNITPGGRACA